jgi:thymidylate synthase
MTKSYEAKYKPNQVIAGSGNVVVVTGWTVRKEVAKYLNSTDYGAVGNLYSPTRGINYLVRNLLLNPQVRFLVIMNGTRADRNSGAGQCLADFFKNGVREGISETGKTVWVINSDILGYIDVEIPMESLDRLRAFILTRLVDDIQDAVNLTKFWNGLEYKAWFEPEEFPLNEPDQTVLPGPLYGHRVEGATIAETWVKIIQRIKTIGAIRPTGYDGKWQELINLMAVVTNEPDGFYIPKPNYLPCDHDFLKEYIPQILDDQKQMEGVKYSYGQRLRSWFGKDQVAQCITKLKSEPDAASAVMSLWDAKDHETGGSPCLNHIWLRIVDGSLSLTATFRSNDMFSAWPSNAFGLRALQKHILGHLQSSQDLADLVIGPLITISQSAHIYSDCWENADSLIQKQYASITRRVDYSDPVGNFLIEIDPEHHLISVVQTTPGSGEIVAHYAGKFPLRILREICTACPCIESAHAGYLGMELQYAYQCLSSGLPYVQDFIK